MAARDGVETITVANDLNVVETFEKDGKQISVAEYFLKSKLIIPRASDLTRAAYRIQLQHKDWPCVDVGGRTNAVVIPVELCIVLPDQPYRGGFSANQRRDGSYPANSGCQ